MSARLRGAAQATPHVSAGISLGLVQLVVQSPALQAKLYRIMWIGAAAALLFSMAGGLVQEPVDGAVLLLQGLTYVTLSLIASRYFQRTPDHATGGFLLVSLIFALGFTRAYITAWTARELGGIAYVIVALPLLLGIAIVWGWAGVMINTAAALLITMLALEASVPQALAGVFLMAAGTVGGVMMYGYMSELDAMQRRLERSASTDLLTRIGNRRALLEDFGRYQGVARKQGVPLLLMSWDLDGLKRLNDREGHAAGDQYILAFVDVLRLAVRQGDSLYRVGGDEFVSLHLGLASGLTIYERVRDSFPAVSGGWTRAANISLDHSLREADEMMYDEKRNHKERITRIIGETAASRG